jgi:hypothetical protein
LRVFDDASVDCGNKHSFVVGDDSTIDIEDSSTLRHELHRSRLHLGDNAISLFFGYRLQEPHARQQQRQQGQGD